MFSLEYARKHHYIENNPARDILTKFEKDGDTPDPYTIEEMQQLFAGITEPEWQLILVLAGLYGLRRGEILGLRWRNVDMEKRTFSVIEQLPYDISAKTKQLSEMAPVKAGERVLPITDWALPYFQTQQAHQNQKKISHGEIRAHLFMIMIWLSPRLTVPLSCKSMFQENSSNTCSSCICLLSGSMT